MKPKNRRIAPEIKSKGRKRINQEALDKIASASGDIIIRREDWKLATPPGRPYLRKFLGREYSVHTLIDNSGWLISKR